MTDTCDKRDESHTKGKKHKTQESILHDSTFMKNREN